jgi:hypothetical protein
MSTLRWLCDKELLGVDLVHLESDSALAPQKWSLNLWCRSGALMLRPPTNWQRDISTRTKRPQNGSSTVTIYYCDTFALFTFYFCKTLTLWKFSTATIRPELDWLFVHPL